MRAEKSNRPGNFRRTATRIGVAFSLLALLAAATYFTLATGVTAPTWLRARIVARLSESMPVGDLNVGSVHLIMFRKGAYPLVRLTDVSILDGDGEVRAVIPEIATELTTSSMLGGEVRPVNITLTGAAILLQRSADGRFDITAGAGDGPGFLQQAGNLAELLSLVDGFVESPALAELQKIETVNSRVILNDAVSGRVWQFNDGAFRFESTEAAISGSVTFKLDNPDNLPAAATFTWSRTRGGDISELTTKFDGFRAEDLADQLSAFDWLRVLDAPISGSFSLALGADGSFGALNGVLDIGGGSIRQNEAVKPIRFLGAKAYLSYDQAIEKMTFDQITLKTDAGEIEAEGHAYLSDRIDRSVGAIIAQLRFSRVMVNPEGVFAGPIEFDFGALDMRVHLSPLKIDLGQLVLVDGDMRLAMHGEIGVAEAGWGGTLELEANTATKRQVLGLWPLGFVGNTRKWLNANILSGRLGNISGRMQLTPGQVPRTMLGFDVAGLGFRFMRTLPPVENARGYGVLEANRLNLVLEQGTMTAPDGGEINLAETTFEIPDVRVANAPAEIGLKTQSAIPSLLTILDLKPFEFLSSGGVPTDVATGTIRTDAKIGLPLSATVTFDQVNFTAEADILDPVSDKLVRGKVLRAERLEAFADNQELTISGSGRLGQLPVTGLWRQEFGPEHRGKSRIEGQVELSQKFVDEFGIALPEGAVQGRGTARIGIDIMRGKEPAFTLNSDLNRVRLALDAVGWVKPKKVTGKLLVRGQFGAPPKIDRLTLKTKGMDAEGTVTLKGDGSLKLARFTRVDVDGWMRAPIDVTIDPNGNAAFALRGGVVDFRKSRFGDRPFKKGTAGNRITTNLDRLILSSGISLTGIEGELQSAAGVTGGFSGRVNGGARIVGTLAPLGGGTAVRFTSTDAGAVMRSAGVFTTARGGRMDMVLVPSGRTGHYDGTLTISNTRVRGASALAELLSAISVVGLLEQLDGEGIAFSDIDAKFGLGPAGVDLRESSAVGASLGLTMSGSYDFTESNMDMQGVITPIYLLNGILEQTKIFGGLFGKQTGEGLFGFNYTVKGSVDDPKVAVNPLSILTPGLFREIFRRPIPKVDQ